MMSILVLNFDPIQRINFLNELLNFIRPHYLVGG